MIFEHFYCPISTSLFMKDKHNKLISFIFLLYIKKRENKIFKVEHNYLNNINQSKKKKIKKDTYKLFINR